MWVVLVYCCVGFRKEAQVELILMKVIIMSVVCIVAMLSVRWCVCVCLCVPLLDDMQVCAGHLRLAGNPGSSHLTTAPGARPHANQSSGSVSMIVPE